MYSEKKCNNLKKNLTLICLSVLLALVIAEIFLRCIHIYGENYPESNCWHYAKWMERHDWPAQQPTGYANSVHDTLYGWILGADIKNAELGPHIFSGMYYANTTHRKTRVTRINDTGKANAPVIITLGNSFTFGDCVNDSETYPAQLQQLLPEYNVVNLGVPGWGIDQMYLRLKNEIQLYHPRYVIIECFFHDLVRAHMTFRDYAKPYFKIDDDKLKLNGVPVPTPFELRKHDKSKLWLLIKSRFDELFNTVSIEDDDALSKMLLDSIVGLCVQNKAVPLFLHIPSKQECLTANSAVPNQFIRASVTNKVFMVDPVSDIVESLKMESSLDKHFSCHFSPLINQGIVQAVSEKIQSIDSVAVTSVNKEATLDSK